METLMKIVKITGQPICAVLYALGVVKAIRDKKPGLLAFMFFAHLGEYFIIGRKTAKEFEISPLKGFLSCLSFGFTWWLPIRMGKKEEAENV